MSLKSLIYFVVILIGSLAYSRQNIVEQRTNDTDGNHHKIVGGVDATSGEFPYQGSLRVGSNLCGCSLINLKWAITAAHCTEEFSQDPGSLTAFFGSVTLYSGVAVGVRAVYNHPDYDSTTFLHDISLLRLESTLSVNERIAPISLPQPDDILLVGTTCSISGFGSTSEDGQISLNLQKADVPVVSDLNCFIWYQRFSIVIHPQEQVCAGYENGGIDSCQGDSGGPLACQSSTGSLVLHGITSFGIGCARQQLPGVYTRVSYYLSWIDETIANGGPELRCNKSQTFIKYLLIPFCLLLLQTNIFKI